MNAFSHRALPWLVILGSAVAVGLLYLGAYLKSHDEKRAAHPADETDKVVFVTSQRAVARSVPREVVIVGTLYGHEEVPISPKVDGTIVRIHHDVGEAVRPGDVLFEIDPTPYKNAVLEAETAVRTEMAKLSLAELPPMESDVNIDSLPSVVKASNQKQWAGLQRERARKLREQQVLAEEEWDRLEIEFASAQASLDQAKLDARTSVALLKQRLAVLESAKQKLSDTIVRVPPQSMGSASGGTELVYLVAERHITEGEIARSSKAEPAMRLVIADSLKMVAAVPERYSNEIHIDQKVRIRTEATGEEAYAGEVSRVSPTVDQTSRTFRVEVSVPNKDRQLPPGSFARALVQTGVDDGAVTVPAEAIVRFAGVVKVFVIRDGKAYGIPVKTERRVDVEEEGQPSVWIEIKGDVKAGDQIVTTGQSELADGSSVKHREDDDASKESP